MPNAASAESPASPSARAEAGETPRLEGREACGSPKGGNEPIDVFELARRNFPIIGFSKTDDLKKEFDVNLIGEPNGLIHLHMRVKPDSIYKDDYKTADIWIDTGKSGLPDKITTTTTNGDIYEIKFASAKANEAIDEKVFEVTIPDGFGEPEIIPLTR